MDTTTFAIFGVLFLVLLAFMWTAIVLNDRRRRIRYGAVSILAAALGFFFTGSVISFTYNSWYSSAADKLVEASVKAMEEGRQEEVIREWKAMDARFRRSYETRGNFRGIAEDAIKGMSGSGVR